MRWTMLFICLFSAACTTQTSTDVRQSASVQTITTQATPQPIPADVEQTPAPAASSTAERIETEPLRAPLALTDQDIAHQLIAQFLTGYPGSCPCPYNSDRAGRRCGGRSAYSRPGGYAPICFEHDVTPEQIQAYRQRLVTASR